MVDILDASGHKLATLDDDGIVRTLSHVKIGHVLANGQVYNTKNQKVGYFKDKGYVYDEDMRHIGNVHNDGRVYDYEGHLAGRIAGGHIESAAAALLLLVR